MFFFKIVADPFSFQTTLHTNGTIVFAYKEVKFGQIGIIDVLSGLLVLWLSVLIISLGWWYVLFSCLRLIYAEWVNTCNQCRISCLLDNSCARIIW